MYCTGDTLCVAGSKVYALWRDKVCYSGHIVSVSSDSQALVAFDDGNNCHVQLDRIIVCDLLPIGSTVLAPRSDDQQWSELATVVSHYDNGSEKGHAIEFIEDKYRCR